MSRKFEAAVGSALFPTPTAGDGKMVGRYSRLSLKSDGWSCMQCGFFNRSENGAGSPGTMNEGNGFVRIVSNEPVVDRGGCALCGTANNRVGG